MIVVERADQAVADVRRATDHLRTDVQTRGYNASPQPAYGFNQPQMLQPIHYPPAAVPSHAGMWPTMPPAVHYQAAPAPGFAWSGPPAYHPGAMPAPIVHGGMPMAFAGYPPSSGPTGSPFMPSPRTLPADSPTGL